LLYILLGKLTDEGQQRMNTDPDLFNVACAGVDIQGAQLLGRYAVLGRFDFVVLVDAIDHEAIARLSLALGSRALAHFETLPAIGISQLGERDDTQPLDQENSLTLERPPDPSLN
jgi:uncharacterized protein with GYD domain